jgi:hypothetical protein
MQYVHRGRTIIVEHYDNRCVAYAKDNRRITATASLRITAVTKVRQMIDDELAGRKTWPAFPDVRS